MQNGFQIEENKSQGFIKLYRSFINWEWYDDANTKALFLHCLLKANHESTKWRGQIIERGSFISSYGIIARELRLTVQKVRTSFLKLISTGEITYKSTNQYSTITINNYELYQENNKQNNNQSTINQQSNNNQITTNKNEKNEKNDKKNFIAKSFFQKLIAEDEEVKKFISFSDSFLKFLQYKTDIKKQYKTGDSVKNAFLKFVRLANNDVNYGVALVDNAIARGWQSIYDLPKEDKIAFQKTKQQNRQFDENYGGF
jgi:hypothetical protein